jgi:mono/diheme cytochrome c family protein
MPVLVALPFWAIVYMGAFGTTSAVTLTPLQQGAKLFATNCSPCHGATGGGGVGPKLAGGEAVKTFPNIADHIAWVKTGSGPHKGQPYGDPNRPGGQHIATTGGMPPFAGTLTDAQIQLVVNYERTGLP